MLPQRSLRGVVSSEPIGTNDPPRWVSLDGSDNAAVDEASNWEDLCWNVGRGGLRARHALVPDQRDAL